MKVAYSTQTTEFSPSCSPHPTNTKAAINWFCFEMETNYSKFCCPKNVLLPGIKSPTNLISQW